MRGRLRNELCMMYDGSKNTQQELLPSIAVSNLMSLAPKIDELRIFLNTHKFDCCCITETWLKDSIDDSVVDISGYNIISKDRTHKLHGGVALYVKDSIKINSQFYGTMSSLTRRALRFCGPRSCPTNCPGAIAALSLVQYTILHHLPKMSPSLIT